MSDRAVALALVACFGCSSGCSVVLDVDGYAVAPPDAGSSSREGTRSELSPGVAAFDHYHFTREGPFAISAADGLSRNDAAQAVIAATVTTSRGGSVELAADGSFEYSPPGAAGVFWGDDHFEYEVATDPVVRARVRLTLDTASFVLNDLLEGGTGFGVAGANVADLVGSSYQSVAPAGDVNGDGLGDFVLGAPGRVKELIFATYEGHGAYVVFGKADSAAVSLADLDGEAARGFAIVPDEPATAGFGEAVAGAGDVNGDGLDDIVIGSPGYDDDGDATRPSGAAYVVFGKRDGAPVTAAGLRSGLGGFVIHAAPDQGLLGYSVAGAGDVDGDGLRDVIVGIPQTAAAAPWGSGGAQVVFGRAGAAPVLLGSDAANERGFFIQGVGEDVVYGVFVAGLGDINGDALDDVSIMTPYVDERRGHVVVVLGKTDTTTLNVVDVENDPALGFGLHGVDPDDRPLGVMGGGDVNADGYDDIVISAPLVTVSSPGAVAPADSDGVAAAPPASTPPSSSGAAYVVYGGRQHSSMSLLDIEVSEGAGFFMSGVVPGQQAATGVGAGDINGDGYSDILAGDSPTLEGGAAYALLGSPTPSSVTLPPASGASQVLQVTASGTQLALGVVASGLDVNGDGIDDMLFGAPLYPSSVQTGGGAYVAFGWDMSNALGERDQALLGGSDDDVLVLPGTPIVSARGGNGRDTLQLDASTAELDLREPGRYDSIEAIDARSGGPQTIRLDETALRRLPQNHQRYLYSLVRVLSVLGDAEDTLEFDMTEYQRRGGANGRVVYARPGALFGVEVSQELRIAPP